MPKVSKDRIDQSILTDYQSNKRFITETVLPQFDRVFEEVRQHNMDLYGAVGSRTIRNKKYEIHKKLLKYINQDENKIDGIIVDNADLDKVPPMLKTFLGFYYDIYTTQTSHIEEIQDYEEYSEVYDDITKHGNFDDVVFCTGIVYEIVDGLFGASVNSVATLSHTIQETKLMEERMIKSNIEKARAESRLKKYVKFVQMVEGDIIKVKYPLGKSIESYSKVGSNEFRNNKILPKKDGYSEKWVRIDECQIEL